MSPNALPKHPNLLYIMTDQERFTQHFPPGWEENNLINMQRLKKHGLTFTNAFTCTSMCSPSRTAMFTGRYPSQTSVTKTLGVGSRYDPHKYDPTDIELDPRIPNLATMLHKSEQYGKINYLGKWHMSKGFDGVQALTPRNIASYGFGGWVPPDGGQDWRVSNIAGGYFDKDNAYTDEAVQFIRERAGEGKEGKPWCLVLSLINPHDIWTYPKSFYQTGYSKDTLVGEIKAPATINENLVLNGKPLAQPELKKAQDGFIGPVEDPEAYLNFYGNLMILADRQIGRVLDELEKHGLWESTIIVRTADHGEMGLAHGGLRQKMFNVYEETIHIPMIISNRTLFPEGKTTDQLASTIDLLPTIASLLSVTPPDYLHGKDLSPLVLHSDQPHKDIRTEVLFTFDDVRIESNRPSAVPAANRIRAVRTKDWKYARYFHADSSFEEEFEMYYVGDVDKNSMAETENLAWPKNKRYNDPVVAKKRQELANLLAKLEKTELPLGSLLIEDPDNK
jgi:choline-sulfatase